MAKSTATSNVYLHVQSTGHIFDFSNVNIITQSSNVKLRRRFEGMHTFKTDTRINRARDVHPFYFTIIWFPPLLRCSLSMGLFIFLFLSMYFNNILLIAVVIPCFPHTIRVQCLFMFQFLIKVCVYTCRKFLSDFYFILDEF